MGTSLIGEISDSERHYGHLFYITTITTNRLCSESVCAYDAI